MHEMLMPRLSDSMEEGTVLRWLKEDGAVVAKGEEVVEIETDKAQMGYEADADGVLRHLVPEHATVPVGAPIATIGTAREAHPAAASAPAAAAAIEATAASVSVAGPTASLRGGISPLARRVAKQLGVEPATVAGSGPNGRILKADVVAAAAQGPADAHGAVGALAPAAATSASATPDSPAATGAKGAVTEQALTRLQETVARRMAESRATVPDFSITVDVDMSAAVALRAQLREAGVRASLNDVLVKATAVALVRHPRVNGAFRDERFELYERVNVGVAVARDDGLVVPTVFDADRRTLSDVAAEIRRLAERVRDGSVTPSELAGGTFTVSNLGMFGVDRFAGVVNPPQAAILCAGAVAPRAQVGADGSIVARETMSLTLVSDHRILYGADAAGFLAEVKALLEHPAAALA